jgi:hypothetical protein
MRLTPAFEPRSAAQLRATVTDMRFGNDANPLLVTVFLVVWIIVGVLQILSHL